MKSKLCLLWALFVLMLPIGGYAQFVHAPKHEFRAVWLTTIKGLDWPKEEAMGDYERQQKDLCRILDSLQVININTVLLQTRIRGDVIYPSSIEPFAPVFTGKHGMSPDYDPLAFAIEECHKRGMQLHAWLVTIPLGDVPYVKGHGRQSLPQKKPHLCTKFKGSWYMEPSNPATIAHLTALVEEITIKYDIDGIHFDYIRYPENNLTYPDGANYKRLKERGESKGDWRRDNVSNLMSSLYHKVKSIKPWVCVSAATLGKYDDVARYSSYGWNAYATVYQDVQKWLSEGVVDAIFPMLYYAGNHFYPFVVDWGERSCGRHVVAGMGTYQLHEDEKNWELEEVVRQLHVVRADTALSGAAQFRSQFVTDNTKGIYEQLRSFYPYPALIPSMPWLSDTPPPMPQGLKVSVNKYSTSLSWRGCEGVSYNIYSSDTYPVDVTNPANLCKTYIRETQYKEFTPSIMFPRHYAITAIDRYGCESAPLQWKNTVIRQVIPRDKKR